MGADPRVKRLRALQVFRKTERLIQQRQEEIISLEAEREKLGKMVARMLASIGEELDCDMGMEEGGSESDETNGENNVYDEKEMAGEKETSKETEKAEEKEATKQQPAAL